MKKAGIEKQSISGQRQERKKDGAGAEMAAGGSSLRVSENSHKKPAITPADRLEAECDLRDVAEYRIEAGCHYEYFRESAMRKSCVLPSSMLFSLSVEVVFSGERILRSL